MAQLRAARSSRARGRAILVNFWTLTCINWLRTQPYNRAWSQAYRDDGLVVVGVHTPEFSFEQEIDRVRPAVGSGVEAAADWDHLRTPETYLGYGRGENFASPDSSTPDQPHVYSLPTYLPFNHWALAGQWTVGVERVRLERAGGSIACRFQARDAHLILSHAAPPEGIPFRVLLDGMAPDRSHGVDVDEGGNGLLKEGRLYQLVREPEEIRERTLEITFLAPGAEAYAFTFG